MRVRNGLVAALAAGVAVTTVVTPAIAQPHPATGVVPAAGRFEPSGQRLLDTRSGLGTGVIAPLGAGRILTFDARLGGPDGAAAYSSVALVLTVIRPQHAGTLSVYDAEDNFDGRASMTFDGSGHSSQQQLTVAMSSGGFVAIRNNSPGALEVLADVLGYYRDGPATQPGMFSPLNARILDTRSGLGGAKARIAGGADLTVPVADHGGIPASGVEAVLANIAVLSAAATGQLSISSGGVAGASTVPIRFVGGSSRQTMRPLRLGSSGALTFHNASARPIDLVVDVAGYFLGGTVTATGGYIPIGAVKLNAGYPYLMPTKGTIDSSLSAFDLGTTDNEVVGFNYQVTMNRPAASGAFGLLPLGRPWNYSPLASFDALTEPTELIAGFPDASGGDTAVLKNAVAGSFLFTAWCTGYYKLATP